MIIVTIKDLKDRGTSPASRRNYKSILAAQTWK